MRMWRTKSALGCKADTPDHLMHYFIRPRRTVDYMPHGNPDAFPHVRAIRITFTNVVHDAPVAVVNRAVITVLVDELFGALVEFAVGGHLH